MSMSEEHAKKHAKKPAVTCCRFEVGTKVTPDLLEDPAIFDDLVDSGLLELDENVLSIETVLGATLKETVDALTPLTATMLDGVVAPVEEVKEEVKEPAVETGAVTVAPSMNAGVLKLHIGKGEDINIELPLVAPMQQAGVATPMMDVIPVEEVAVKEVMAAEEEVIKRSVERVCFAVKEINLGEETKFENGILTVRKSLVDEAIEMEPLVKEMEMDIITPNMHDIYTDSMMDVQPIAVKVEGKIGEGITHTLDGAIMLLTGVDEAGKQIADANASNGIIGEQILFGRPGSPDIDDIMLRIHVTIADGSRMERPGPYAAHKAADHIVDEIRQVLKKCNREDSIRIEEFKDIDRKTKPRIVLIKEIMGQGAMHDNLILPQEPAGFLGGRPNVDLGNLPVLLTPNEVRDGGIHALTCITPDTKETTRAYWREPFIKRLAEDEEFNFLGVIFVGSPQANVEKFYVSERLGRWIEAMKIDGAIVTTEGFGNNHIDFASHIEEIGSLDVPVVGVSFCGVQGALVVGNKYMDTMVDLSVSEGGVNSDRLSENSITPEAALRATAMLKDKMMGVYIEEAEHEWLESVRNQNYELAKKSHHEN